MIGTAECCDRLERQLDLMDDRPVSLGWVVSGGREPAGPDPVLGSLRELDAIVARTRPDLALVTFPAVMDRLVTTTRTRLRRLGVAVIKTPGFTACRVFQIVSYAGMGDTGQASKAVAALLEQVPTFTVEDAVRSVGFPGDENSNQRLAKQLIEAGLPQDKGASVTR